MLPNPPLSTRIFPYMAPIQGSKVIVNEKGAGRIKGGHPWVFRSDVVSATGVEPGDVVCVQSRKGQYLGQAFYSPRSQITLRMITRRQESIDRTFWKRRIETAIGRRAILGKGRSTCRLIHGESDFIPSVILDRYDNVLVFQTLSAGGDRLRDEFLSLFEELLSPQAIIERNDPPVRDLEGLLRQKGIVRGGVPIPFEVTFGDRRVLVDPLEGQKTGLFLDQVENHAAAASYTRGRVLDLFCYQGGFALRAAAGAREVVAVDSSGPALAVLRENCIRNGIVNIHPVEANGFDTLRQSQDRHETFETVILDPPPFARDRKNVSGALRGYKEINLRAMKLLAREGILVSCSCSQNFGSELFEEILMEAARDAHREIQVLERRGAAPDHPVLLTFPESAYLQCWVLRVI